eukprot:4087278-Pyramimonas_sp.AAC.1
MSRGRRCSTSGYCAIRCLWVKSRLRLTAVLDAHPMIVSASALAVKRVLSSLQSFCSFCQRRSGRRGREEEQGGGGGG